MVKTQSIAAIRIYIIRDKKVVLGRDLAALYGVSTAAISQTVKRHIDRFPEKFSFQLNREEVNVLMSTIATSKSGRGRKDNLPLVFTEQGVYMLSIITREKRVAQINRMIDWHSEGYFIIPDDR